MNIGKDYLMYHDTHNMDLQTPGNIAYCNLSVPLEINYYFKNILKNYFMAISMKHQEGQGIILNTILTSHFSVLFFPPWQIWKGIQGKVGHGYSIGARVSLKGIICPLKQFERSQCVGLNSYLCFQDTLDQCVFVLYLFIFVCVCVYMYTYIYICICICRHIHMYMYIWIHK